MIRIMGRKKTDGHPHSHTCSQLPLRFVSLMMMRGYRKVRGCENSKVTWYPRQPLPTSAKSVVVYNFRVYSYASSSVMLFCGTVALEQIANVSMLTSQNDHTNTPMVYMMFTMLVIVNLVY